jgi:uncharacterized protein YcbK (DUF882 family)
VKLHVALPSASVDFPIEVHGDPTGLEYVWVRASDGVPAVPPRRLEGITLSAPPRPGIYQLALVKGTERRVVEGVSLAVLVPFEYKLGASSLNGYRIGTYASERWGGERPLGFLEVDAGAADLPVSEHLRLRDFLTRDEQTQWPRYAVLSPRILDKMELVLTEVYKLRGRQVKVDIDVHSGFRTPMHNARVEGAAVNSRHQYGDAVDIAIDADGDGRLTSFDGRIVGAIVEFIEKKNPGLVGGLGLYVGPTHASPYVHIDARGRRARWWS